MWLWHGVGGWPRNHERVCGAQRRPTELRDPVYVSISVPVLGVRYLVCMYLIFIRISIRIRIRWDLAGGFGFVTSVLCNEL